MMAALKNPPLARPPVIPVVSTAERAGTLIACFALAGILLGVVCTVIAAGLGRWLGLVPLVAVLAYEEKSKKPLTRQKQSAKLSPC